MHHIHLYTSICSYAPKTKVNTQKILQPQTCFVSISRRVQPNLPFQTVFTPPTAPQRPGPISRKKSPQDSPPSRPEVGLLKTEPLADAEAQEILWSTSEQVGSMGRLGFPMMGFDGVGGFT